MKSLFYLIIIFILGILSCYGQDDTGPNDSSFNANAEIARMVNIPNSPEATAFTQYGNTSANMYTGTPNIQVPIYTLKGRELDLPISLTYDASGIKVEQLATQVGLGWNLNVGGRISRSINGAPDDFFNASPRYYTIWDNTEVRQPLLNYADISNSSLFDSEQHIIDYLDFLKDIHDGKYDALPDYFSFNALGINDYFVFDVNTMQPRALNNPRIKVGFTKGSTNSILTWKVINEDGTTFYFEEYETTDSETTDLTGTYGVIKSYNSSWVLTKIESKNKKDIYELIYTSTGQWSQPEPASLVQSVTVKANDNNIGSQTYPAAGGTLVNSTYKISQKFLTSIKYNGKKIIGIDLASRNDLHTSNLINKINVYRIDQDNAVLKNFDFKYSYFKDKPGTAEALANHKRIRLKLDKIDINSPNNTLKSYSFEYDSPNSLPERSSLSQDYLGYFNGVRNTVLYPMVRIGEDTYDGANRYPDFNYAKIGTLTKMTYPTGGSTSFEYEPHFVKESVNITSTGQRPNTIIKDVYYVLERLSGGTTGPCPPTDYECQDEYPNGAPKKLEFGFSVEESGNYNVAGEVTSTTACCQKPFNIEISQKNLSSGTWELVWGFSSGQRLINFEKGITYRVRMLNPNQGRTLTAKVWREEEVELNNQTGFYKGKAIAAGLRIKAIRDYSDTNVLALQKEYQYNDDGNGSTLFTPKLEYKTVSEYVNTNPNDLPNIGIRNIIYSNRVASTSGGDRAHIVYGKVIETLKGSGNNGYTQYLFNTSANGSGVFSYGVPPFANHYLINHKHAKPREVNVYNKDNAIVSKTKTSYTDVRFNPTIKGMYIDFDGGATFNFPIINPSSSHPGKYTFKMVKGVYNAVGWNGNGAVMPPCVVEPNIGRCLSNSYGPLNKEVSVAGSRVGYTVNVEKTEYFDTKNVSTTTNYTYDPDVDFLLRETTTTDSNNTILKNKLYYPKDNNVTGANVLVANNRLNEVVKTESYNDNSLLFTQKTDYNVSLNNGVVMPDVIFTQKSTVSGNQEDRLHYEYYDNGNLKESYITDGTHTVYIWGYNDRLPIAKIENATFTEVSAQVLTLQNKSDADNDRTVNEGVLRSALNELRNSLPNAMVSTYTYDPLIGVTSMTDPKGYTMYYVYDEFHRLDHITDEDGHVLKKYNYNYSGTEASDYTPLSLTVTGTAAFTGLASNFVANASGGSGNFEYKWLVDGQPINDTTASISPIFTTPGAHTVTCILRDIRLLESKEVEQTVTVYAPLQTPTLSSNVTHALSGATIAFTAGNISGGSGSRAYEWYVNDVKQSATSTTFSKSFSAGTYTVTFRVKDNTIAGHYKENTKTVYVYAPIGVPSISSDITYGLSGATITFAGGNITGGSGSKIYEWYVNDIQQRSSSLTFSKSFNTGKYEVTFRVKDTKINGHFKEVSKIVYLYAPLNTPSISSSATHAVSGVAVNFTAGNIGGGSGGRAYEWYVNDVKQSATSTTFSKAFSVGTHTIRFRVKDNNISGHHKETSKTIYVYPSLTTPTLEANIYYAVSGSTINLTAGNIGGGSGSRSYEWYINDVKQSATGTTFSKSFTTGVYKIRFRVKDSKIIGHYKEHTRGIHVFPPLNTPNLTSDKTYVLEGATIKFTPSGIGGGSGSRRYEWYINNVKQSGTSGSGFSYKFSTNGTYTIKFRVVDTRIANHYKEKTKTVYVYDSMVTGSISSGNPVTVNTNNTFNINPSKGSGYYAYSWTIKGNWKTYTSTSKSFSLNMNYDYYGTTTATCTVRDTRTGETKTTSRTITINGATAPVSKFSLVSHNVNSYYQHYRLPVGSYGGSGHFTYRWYVDGAYVSNKDDIYIYLDCSNKRDVVKLETKDVRTGLKSTYTKTYNTKTNCGGGGGGGTGDGNHRTNRNQR